MYQKFGEMGDFDEDDHQNNNELSLLECEIDKILLEAWNGMYPLTEEQLTSFHGKMSDKKGQKIFTTLLNQFRLKRDFKLVN